MAASRSKTGAANRRSGEKTREYILFRSSDGRAKKGKMPLWSSFFGFSSSVSDEYADWERLDSGVFGVAAIKLASCLLFSFFRAMLLSSVVVTTLKRRLSGGDQDTMCADVQMNA
jgi:hypothetical protein